MTAQRRAALRQSLRDTRPESGWVLVSSLPNIRYLTGFSGSNAFLLVDLVNGEDVLATDGRYAVQAAQQTSGLGIIVDRATLPALLAAVPLSGLLVESTMSIASADLVRSAGISFDPVAGAVEQLRAVKDHDEIRSLERASHVTAQAMQVIASEIRIGQTEISIARRLEQLFGELGADDRAFETIVATGANCALPHHRPSRDVVRQGDLIVIDAGAQVDGYHADMTRTHVAGEPQEWQADVHAAVLAAYETARAGYRPGAEVVDVDGLARATLASRGLGERFTHGLGHGVGLEVHEAPWVGPRGTGSMTACMTITAEPGAYLPGRGGVRIEDTLVITDDGSRCLTEAPRDLISVG